MSPLPSSESKFGHLTHTECHLLYLGLKLLLESEDGAGFHNADKGHPFILSGAMGEPWIEHGDVVGGPADHDLFKLLSELSERMKEAPSEISTRWFTDFSSWQQFCKAAYSAYTRNRGMPDPFEGGK